MNSTSICPVDVVAASDLGTDFFEALKCYLCLGEETECTLADLQGFLESAYEMVSETYVPLEYGTYDACIEHECGEAIYLNVRSFTFEDDAHVYGVDTWIKDPAGNLIPLDKIKTWCKKGKIMICDDCYSHCACSGGGCNFWDIRVVSGYKTLPICVKNAIFELVGLMFAAKKNACLLSSDATSTGECSDKIVSSQTVGKYSVSYDTFNSRKEVFRAYSGGSSIESLSVVSKKCLERLCITRVY